MRTPLAASALEHAMKHSRRMVPLILLVYVSCLRPVNAQDPPQQLLNISTAITRSAFQSVDLQKLNQDLLPERPTVDIAICLAEPTDEPHPYAAEPGDLTESFLEAKQIYSAVGVQLRLISIERVQVPEAMLSLQANTINGPASPAEYNAYLGYQREQWSLTQEATTAFRAIIPENAANADTIFLIYLKQVRMACYDQASDSEAPAIRTLSTGGLSLPAYLLEDRIPRRLRGAITICRRSGQHGRLIAHELGHKLINVSHEYKQISPQFEVRGEGGLMLYGSGTDIPGEETGRWHRERLHLSPFLYRRDANGTLRRNRDYISTGHYYDPLYGNYVIRFGEMTPSPLY